MKYHGKPFIRIENEWFDGFRRWDFSLREYRMLLSVMRYTIGFRSRITVRSWTFEKWGIDAGLSRPAAFSVIRRLVLRRVLDLKLRSMGNVLEIQLRPQGDWLRKEAVREQSIKLLRSGKEIVYVSVQEKKSRENQIRLVKPGRMGP